MQKPPLTKTVADKKPTFPECYEPGDTSDLYESVLTLKAVLLEMALFLMNKRLLIRMSFIYTVELLCFPILTGDRIRTSFLINLLGAGEALDKPGIPF